jgi:hypothetical protein
VGPETILATDSTPSRVPSPPPLVELTYASAAMIGRDRLPQLPRGLLARTTAPVSVGDAVTVSIEARLEAMTIRARGEVRWVTSLATGKLVGLSLEGESDDDRHNLEHVLDAPAGGGAAMTPALTPALAPVLRFSQAPVLSVAMLQPNPVLRHILGGALAKVTARLGERWTLKLEGCATADAFLASMASRQRQLAIIDCDAFAGTVDALIDAIRSHEYYQRLPIVLLSGDRPARLEDRFAVTLQKPLTVKSFLHTTELLLRS